PIATTKIQNAHRRCNSQRFDDHLSGLAHEGRDLSKVAFFPQCLVWIHTVSFLAEYPRTACARCSSSQWEKRRSRYNCPRWLPKHPCPSVAILCSDGQSHKISLLRGRGALQKVQEPSWTSFPRFSVA